MKNSKKYLFLMLTFLVFVNSLFSQDIKQFDKDSKYMSGKVIIRFADNFNLEIKGNKSGNDLIDKLFKEYKVINNQKLFPNVKSLPNNESGFTTYNGFYVQYPKLNNIYLFEFEESYNNNIKKFIKDLTALGKELVLYAEPNFIFEADVTVPTDPLYASQYNARSMKMDSIWQLMNSFDKKDSNIVIAILDTGVDTAHIDLTGKAYKNSSEKNGITGVDDDGNGFIDDYSGWDFVNNDNKALDDHSHGTHCASIAVASHNNGTGIAGIAPGAKYLPIKILQSSGYGNAATISQGIVYAATNNAHVLSMSFGGYGRSIAMENALSYAYAFSFLVAAAGNDGLCIRNDGMLCPDGRPPLPMFPAALPYVLGVQASQQNANAYGSYRSWFSNYDFDGPTYTDFGDKLNYEVYAPGSAIIGALQGTSSYVSWNGTSMAAPAVAAAVGIYKVFRPTSTKERTFVDFIQSWYNISGTFTKDQGYSSPSIDMVKAIFPTNKTAIWMEDKRIVDTGLSSDADGKPDAGETVRMVVDVRNLGVASTSVYAGIRIGKFEDKSVVTFIDSISFIGSISEYGKSTNILNPFKFKINNNVVNGRDIVLNIYTWVPGSDTNSQNFVITAQKGCEYSGIYTGKTVWTKNCEVIVTNNAIFDTLIIGPGTVIQIDPGVGVAYNVIVANGKPDSMIVFTKNKNSSGTWQEIRNVGLNNSVFKYCLFEYGGRSGNQWGGAILAPEGKVSLENCIVQFCHSYYGTGWNIITLRNSNYIRKSIFQYNFSNLPLVGLEDDNWTGNFSNNLFQKNTYIQYYGEQPAISFRTINDLNRITNNTFLEQKYLGSGNSRSKGYVLGVRDGNGGGHAFSNYVGNSLDSNFFGTINSTEINKNIFDFEEYSSFPSINGATKKLSKPKKQTPGHVAKVEIDNVDINILDNNIPKIIGAGLHSIKVVFNKPMKVSMKPFVSFGVREPYTQNIISDSSTWSADSTTWSAKFIISQLTSSDGYNKISIRNIKDNLSFEMPIEDNRFEFKINVAGALSSGFNAIGDSASIKLSWRKPLAIFDLIGYNIYRVDTSLSNDTIRINSNMIIDTNYVDFNVKGGVAYKYYYKSARGNLTESVYSVPVIAEALSSRPLAITNGYTELDSSSVKLKALIDPNFLSTQARFTFGTNKNSLNMSTSFFSVGSIPDAVSYSKTIGGLIPGTKYYFRVEAINAIGINNSKVDSFITKKRPILSFTTPPTICMGNQIQLIVKSNTSDKLIKYSWNFGQGIIKVGDTIYHVFTTTGSQTISVTASGPGTISNSKTISLTVNPGSSIASFSVTQSGSTSFCKGGSLLLDAGSGYSSYLWSNGATTRTVTITQSGTYNVLVTNGAINSCPLKSYNVVVNVNPTPLDSISLPTGNSACIGSVVKLIANQNQNYSYKWFKNDNEILGVNSNEYNVSTSGLYKLQITNQFGCATLTNSQQVVINPLPIASVSMIGDTVFCNGDSLKLIANSGLGYTYNWNTGKTSKDIVVKNSGTYFLDITNSFGCKNRSKMISVNVKTTPQISINSVGGDILCFGGSKALSATSGFKSYIWDTGDTTQNIILSYAGNISVKGLHSNGCYSNEAEIKIKQDTMLNFNISLLGKSVICNNDSLLLSVINIAGANYLWSNGINSNEIWVKEQGAYSCMILKPSGCVQNSQTVFVQSDQNVLPQIYYNQNSNLLISSFESGNQWFLNDTLILNANLSTYAPLLSGVYTVKVINANGCVVKSTGFYLLKLGIGDNLKSQLKIYPNPTNDKIYINGVNKEELVKIYDIQGKLIESITIYNDAEIDLSKYDKGVYLIKINGINYRQLKF
jgi:subtilisin family serine protease